MPAANFVLFGDPQLTVDGNPVNLPSNKAVALLAYLALHDGTLSRQRLSYLLWSDASTTVAQTSLRNTLHAIRQTPLVNVIAVDRHNISLSHEVEVDVLKFDDYLKRLAKERCESQVMATECLSLMQQAVELYRGDFLTNFNVLNSPEFDDWQMLVRVNLQYEVTVLLAKLARYYTDQGITRSAIRMLYRWLELDPVNEEAHQLLMQAYAFSGQTEQAIQQYHNLSRQIKRELGRLPDQSVQMVYRHIKSGDYAQMLPKNSVPKPIRSILPILQYPMTGREADLQHLKSQVLNQTTDHFVITLSGAPGIGKSMLAQALANDLDIQQHFRDAILWGSLNEQTRPDDILRLWLDALRVSVLKSSCRSEHLALQLRTGLYNKRILLIIDNVRSYEELSLFNLGGSAATILITPHLYRIGLPAVNQAQNAITLAPLASQDADTLLGSLAHTLVEHYPAHASAITTRYGAYPAAIRAIGYAYQQHIHIWGNANALLDKLLDDTAILALPGGDGKTLTEQFERYWKSIDAQTQAQIQNLLTRLDRDVQYTRSDLSEMWSDNPDALKLLFDYGLLIQTHQGIMVHRLLGAY
jgi:DNA-binding SARP family transcriptional activator